MGGKGADEPLGHVPGHECSLLEIVDGRVEARLDPWVLGDVARVHPSVETKRYIVCVHALLAESRDHRIPRELCDRTQRRDTEPAESCCEILRIQCSNIHVRKEPGVVLNHVDGLIIRCEPGRLLGCKRPPPQADSVIGPECLELLVHPLDEGCLPLRSTRPPPAVGMSIRPGWMTSTLAGPTPPSCVDEGLEPRHLCGEILSDGDNCWTYSLGCPTPHTNLHPGSDSKVVSGNDPSVLCNRLGR